jgi:hypothetical protein
VLNLLLGAILGALATVMLVVVIVAYLNWDKLKDWIFGYRKLCVEDKDNIAFSITEKVEKGKASIVHGVFNKRTEQIVTGAKVTAKEVDPEVIKAHADKLVVYD